MDPREESLEKIDRLIEKGNSVRGMPGHVHVLYTDAFEEWRTGTLEFLRNLLGEDSQHCRDFQDRVKDPSLKDCETGIGILKALRTSIEEGYFEMALLHSKEFLRGFLAEAESQLSQGRKDAAAVIAGAVLADALRKLCRRYRLPVEEGQTIGALSEKLAKRAVYLEPVQKKILSWTLLREEALSGRCIAYDDEDVKDMIDGLRYFVDNYLQ